jgi:hypothetical protein
MSQLKISKSAERKKSRFVLLLYQRGHDKAQKRDENKTLRDKELETKVE